MPSELVAIRIVSLLGLTVTARELTVSDVRAWLMEIEADASIDPFYTMLFDGFSVCDLSRMSDASITQLETFTPSELEPLANAAKALNPDFFDRQSSYGGRCRSDDIDRSCCALVSHGHSGVWQYPWKTYLTAIRSIAKT